VGRRGGAALAGTETARERGCSYGGRSGGVFGTLTYPHLIVDETFNAKCEHGLCLLLIPYSPRMEVK
jgi:hypothetical protein